MFMSCHSRQQPAHNSDTNAGLVVELKAFLKAVAKPGLTFIKEDFRNINLLSLREDTETSSFDTSEPSAAVPSQKKNVVVHESAAAN